MFCTIYKEKILLFQCKFDLEGEGQGHWFSNSSEILVETISIPNLMQIAEELEKLSRSQEITQTTTPDDDDDGRQQTKNNMSPPVEGRHNTIIIGQM